MIGQGLAHVTVVPILTPAGFVGVDHWAGADAVHHSSHRWLGLLRGLMNGAHNGPHAEAQLMDGAQIPLDAAEGSRPSSRSVAMRRAG